MHIGAAVRQALAVVGESDRALRELMSQSLKGAAYTILEIGSVSQLEAVLRTRQATNASTVFLVVSAGMFKARSAAAVAFPRWRAALGRPAPHALLTCEFGTLAESSTLDFGEYLPAGILEKPFDLTLLQSIAYRCRVSEQALRPGAMIR